MLTGATGLIGSAVLERLLQAGHQIHCLGRRDPLLEQNSDVKLISVDFSKRLVDLTEFLSGVDVVIHAGAHKGGGSSKDLEYYREININFTNYLFNTCAKISNIKKVVYLSGLNFLQKPLRERIDEEHPLAPVSPYGISKYWGEICLKAYSQKNYKGVTLRISSPLPLAYEQLPNTVVKKWIDAAAGGQDIVIFGSGLRSQDFVSVGDVAQAVEKVIDLDEAEGVFNVGSGIPIKMREMAEIIAQAFGVQIVHGEKDPQEDDRWNLDIRKSSRILNYQPLHHPRDVLRKLIKSYENSHP